MELNDDELEEFNNLISGILIPGLIRMADKYNIDRDSLIDYTVAVLGAMSEYTIFKDYKLKSRGK